MITLSPAQVSDPPELSVVCACIRRHRKSLPRLDRLRRYFEGKNDMAGRAGEDHMCLPHPIARYISLMASGYLTGRPVRYEAPDQPEAMERLKRTLQLSASDSVDSELSLNASVFGKGVERIYTGPDGLPHTASLSPMEAFVVYDDTVAHAPLFGVHLSVLESPDGAPKGLRFDVLTKTRCLTYEAPGPDSEASARLTADEPHFFPDVPVIEYWNNFDETGDFEPVLPLIDGYDSLQESRLKDKQQFVDSLLVLTGCQLRQTYHTVRVTDENGVVSEQQVPDDPPSRKLLKDRFLALPDSDASAQYLSHTFHEADTEVLRNALREDIHRLSLVPDLSDRAFAGNLSGVAMRYKLMGLEQLTSVKERWFREALLCRLRLFSACLSAIGGPAPDVSGVKILFTRSLPEDREAAARVVSLLSGVLPPEALRAFLPGDLPEKGGDPS